MTRSVRDKVAVVTGASRGLGAAVATALARRGAHVALLGRARDRLEAVADRVRSAGAEALVVAADVRDRSALDAAIAAAMERWDRVDLLFNVAAMKMDGPMESASDASVREAIEVNVVGALRCCQAVLPSMRTRGSGHLVNVSSVLGKRATPYRGAYSASKAALNAITDALRVELAGTGVDVTLVCPGRLDDRGDSRRMAMGYDRAAGAIVRAVERRRREVVLTVSGRAMVWLDFLAPGMVDRMLRGVCSARRRDFERGERVRAGPPPGR